MQIDTSLIRRYEYYKLNEATLQTLHMHRIEGVTLSPCLFWFVYLIIKIYFIYAVFVVVVFTNNHFFRFCNYFLYFKRISHSYCLVIVKDIAVSKPILGSLKFDSFFPFVLLDLTFPTRALFWTLTQLDCSRNSSLNFMLIFFVINKYRAFRK